MDNFTKYSKFWMALTAPLGVLLFVAAPTNLDSAFHVSVVEWYQVVVALAAAVGVRQISNK